MIVYNTKEVAEILHLKEETVRRMIRKGILNASRTGKQKGLLRISEESVKEYLDKKGGVR